jgi:hypothetical protein
MFSRNPNSESTFVFLNMFLVFLFQNGRIFLYRSKILLKCLFSQKNPAQIKQDILREKKRDLEFVKICHGHVICFRWSVKKVVIKNCRTAEDKIVMHITKSTKLNDKNN